MSWTTPRTWSTGEVVTAALMNTHVRDNDVCGMERGTSLPVSPQDGQLYCYTADATNGIEWLLKYHASDPTSFKWHFIGGCSLRATGSAVAETRNNSSYGALTTACQITVPLGGDFDISVTATSLGTTNTTGVAYSSYAVGASAATDADALILTHAVSANYLTQSATKVSRKTGVAASTVIAMQHRNTGSVNASYTDRVLTVVPIRVG